MASIFPSKNKIITFILQESFPVRIHAIHVVNEPVVFAMAFAIFKTFLSERMTERVSIFNILYNRLRQVRVIEIERECNNSDPCMYYFVYSSTYTVNHSKRNTGSE